jgi:hypothetical protein
MQWITCKLKMATCNWNGIKLKNSHIVGGGKWQDFFLW